MIINFFRLATYIPLYNGFVYLIDVFPWFDAGIAIIVFTLIIKFILFPLSKKAVVTQLKIKKIEPEVKKLRAETTDKQEQAKLMMELYKKEKINPFSGIFLTIIQIPIILSLYFVFKNGFPIIDSSILYHFVPTPDLINPFFIGLIDVSKKSIILALLAGVSSYFQIKYSVPTLKKKDASQKANFKEDLARSMNVQMRYGMPLFIAFTAYVVGGAVALYWVTSNVFTLLQEIYFRKKLKKE